MHLALEYRDVGDTEPRRPRSRRAADVAALARASVIERASLVGVSMGGFVALELALRRAATRRAARARRHVGGVARPTCRPPARSSLLLTPGDEEVETGAGARRVCSAVAAPGFAARAPEEIETFVAIALYRPMTRDGVPAPVRGVPGARRRRPARPHPAPTLVLHGDVDPLVPLANGEAPRRHIAGARLVVYPGTGHIPEVECADEFNRDLLGF